MRTVPSKQIPTERLTLLSCDEKLLAAAIGGNETLARFLEAEVPAQWTEFGEGPWSYARQQILTDVTAADWWTYFPVLRQENILVGSCGYKGPPNDAGIVEIGYETAPAYRRRGLATEMAEGLLRNAFADERVQVVQAHTLAEENPSTRLLGRCGFAWVKAIEDPEDGAIWQWAITRADYERRQPTGL